MVRYSLIWGSLAFGWCTEAFIPRLAPRGWRQLAVSRQTQEPTWILHAEKKGKLRSDDARSGDEKSISKIPRLRTIDEVGSARVTLGRDDCPPTPDTQFPASVDYLLTISVDVGGKPRTFTLDTTASVNLVTRVVAEELKARERGGGGVKGKGMGTPSGKGFGAKKAKREEEEDEEILLDLILGSEPRICVTTPAVVSDAWGGAGCGCLGLPFLRTFGFLDIDLCSLQTTVRSYQETLRLQNDGVEAELGLPVRDTKEWSVDFAPLTVAGVTEEEARKAVSSATAGEIPEVWVVDMHLDGSEEAVPAIVDLGSQATVLNWEAGRALGYKLPKRAVVTNPMEGIHVALGDITQINVAKRISVPNRMVAMADLPVFEYAGLHDAPAMVLGLDVLGSGKRLLLDWTTRRLQLFGPFLPPKKGRADVELPLYRFDSSRLGSVVPPFGVERQYGVLAKLGSRVAKLMVDTAAGGIVVSKDAWAQYCRINGKKSEGKSVDMSGTGGRMGAMEVSLDMTLGCSEHREGYPLTAGAAVVDKGTSQFDGFLGLSLFQNYDIADFDFRHQMLRLYKLNDTSSPANLTSLLDYWPIPDDARAVTSAPLSKGLDSLGLRPETKLAGEGEIVGAGAFLFTKVTLDGRGDVDIVGLIDTGGQASVLNHAAAEALGLNSDSARLDTSGLTAYGLDGREISLQYARFEEVVMGDLRLKGRNIAIADIPGIAKIGLLHQPAMIIGLDLLDAGNGGRLVLDTAGARMYITD